MWLTADEIDIFFTLIKKIADDLEQESWWLDLNNSIQKANLIRAALNRVQDELNNKQNPDSPEVLCFSSINELMNYKQDNQLSLLEAIDFKRYFFEKKPTSTLSTLEEKLRKIGYNAGYRQLIEVMRKKVALEYRNDIDNIEVKKNLNRTKLILPDQGLSQHSTQPTESMNGHTVSILNNAKLPTLIAKVRYSNSFLVSRSVSVSFQEDCYQKIIDGLDALPDHQQVTDRYYNK